MSIIIAILPIIIIIALPVILMRLRVKFVTVKITHWLLIIYIGLLLLLMAIVPFLSGDETIRREKFREVDSEQPGSNLLGALSKGEIGQIDSKYLVMEKNFDYDNPVLTILSNRDWDPTIYVERKTSDDGKIEAFVYSSGLIIDGYDFTEHLIPINFGLEEETLTIYHPGQQDINISMVKNEFTVNQFKEQKENSDKYFGHEEKAIYLRIPKSLKLSKVPNDLIFVGE